MIYPTTRFVFDRKKTATRKKDALIQVEILYLRRKRYVGTGIRVYAGQWDSRQMVVHREDALTLNERIRAVKESIDGFLTSLIRSGTEFTWERLDAFLKREERHRQSFYEYVEMRIMERNDITESTRKSHTKILSSLREFGRIMTWEELTRANIADYYDWLLGRTVVRIGRDGRECSEPMKQQTAWGYMKILRTYIHDAIVHERIDHDPSIGVKVSRGTHEQTRWLTEEEMRRIEEAELSSGSLVRVRDLFVLCCNTGLAFSDLMDFQPGKLERDGEYTYLYGRRKKTGQEYIVLILPKAMEILEKYGYQLPRYSNQQYNHRLKDVAREAKVDKPLSSHYGRITFGFLALNRGVRIEVVSKAMGHATISETQRTYSRILRRTVVSEMSRLNGV